MPSPNARMTEAELQAAAEGICRLLGLRYFHNRWAMGSAKGFPDLVICARAPGLGLLYRELKTERGKLTGHQRGWLSDLKTAGENADIWRPADLRSGRIVAELKALT